MCKGTEKIIESVLPAKRKSVFTFLKECLTMRLFMATNPGKLHLTCLTQTTTGKHAFTKPYGESL